MINIYPGRVGRKYFSLHRRQGWSKADTNNDNDRGGRGGRSRSIYKNHIPRELGISGHGLPISDHPSYLFASWVRLSICMRCGWWAGPPPAERRINFAQDACMEDRMWSSLPLFAKPTLSTCLTSKRYPDRPLSIVVQALM